MVQRFIDGDEEENKFFNVFNNVVQTTLSDIEQYFINAYGSPELGRALYETQRVPIYKMLEKSLFIKAYNKILEGEAYIGTIEGYLTILRAIFGDNADIKLTIVAPLHLRFDITAEIQQFYIWVDNEDNEIVDENGDNIVFEEIVALLSNRQLLEILKQTTNAGTFVEFNLNEVQNGE